MSGGKHFAYGQSLGGRRGSSATHVKNPFSTMIKIPSKMGKKVVGLIMRVPKSKKMEGVVTSGGLGKAYNIKRNPKVKNINTRKLRIFSENGFFNGVHVFVERYRVRPILYNSRSQIIKLY